MLVRVSALEGNAINTTTATSVRSSNRHLSDEIVHALMNVNAVEKVFPKVAHAPALVGPVVQGNAIN